MAGLCYLMNGSCASFKCKTFQRQLIAKNCPIASNNFNIKMRKQKNEIIFFRGISQNDRKVTNRFFSMSYKNVNDFGFIHSFDYIRKRGANRRNFFFSK